MTAGASSLDAGLAALESRNEAELQAEVRANAMQAIPDKTLVKSLQERVRQHAASLGIEPEILATKRDLIGVASNDPPMHLRTGWRATKLAPILERNALPV